MKKNKLEISLREGNSIIYGWGYWSWENLAKHYHYSNYPLLVPKEWFKTND